MAKRSTVRQQLAQVTKLLAPPRGMDGGPPVLRVTAETTFYPKPKAVPKPGRARRTTAEPMPVTIVSVGSKAKRQVRKR
jgi:hypothetical protein